MQAFQSHLRRLCCVLTGIALVVAPACESQRDFFLGVLATAVLLDRLQDGDPTPGNAEPTIHTTERPLPQSLR